MLEDLRRLLVDQTVALRLIKRVIINYEKLPKASVTLDETRTRLTDLKTLWEKARRLHASIILAATAEERKTLPYFVREEFFAVEDAYNDAADLLCDAISNFVKPDNAA